MGAELIAVYQHVQLDSSTGLPHELQLAHALQVVDDLPLPELSDFYENATGDSISTPEQARELLRERITTVVEEIGTGRNVLLIIAPNATHATYVAGGTSYGDDPNDAYRAMSDLLNTPTVCAALGFVHDS